MLLRITLGLCLCLAGAPRCLAQPVVHLNFDDPFNLGADASGRGNHGNASGGPAARGQGVAGGAAQFDGNGYLALNNSVAATLAGDYTISFWIETTASAGNDGDDAELGAGILALDDTDTTIALTGNRVGFEHANPNATIHSQSPVNTGNFVHVVVRHDAGTGEQSLFVNGALEATRQGSATSAVVQNLLALGANPSANRFFTGSIDDFQVYNQALNASSVAFLHANPGSAVIQSLAIPEPPVLALVSLGSAWLGGRWLIRRRRAR